MNTRLSCSVLSAGTMLVFCRRYGQYNETTFGYRLLLSGSMQKACQYNRGIKCGSLHAQSFKIRVVISGKITIIYTLYIDIIDTSIVTVYISRWWRDLNKPGLGRLHYTI